MKDKFENMKESVCLFTARFKLAAGLACLAASGCYGATNLAGDGQTDAYEETDGTSEAEDEGTDGPDIPDVREDGEDRIEISEDGAEDASDAETSLSCEEPVGPLEGSIDPTYAKNRETFIFFEGPSGNRINTNVIQEAGMVVEGPLVELGSCTGTDATVAIAAPGATINATPDVSVTVGSSRWEASVPVSGGELCDPVSPDDVPLRTLNDRERTIVKNALYGDGLSRADFTLGASDGLLIVNDEASSGPVLVAGSAFSPVTTVLSAIPGGGVINVRAYTSLADVEYDYSALLGSLESRQLRVYPVESGDSQMYGVAWDAPEATERAVWCARCTGQDVFVLRIPGEALCNATDECGCVGDGFSVEITDAAITEAAPRHLAANYSIVPSSASATGMSAMSAGSEAPAIELSLQRTPVAFDGGERVNLTVELTIVKTSQHANPSTGTVQQATETIYAYTVDPWAWGSTSPTYSSACGCPPVY